MFMMNLLGPLRSTGHKVWEPSGEIFDGTMVQSLSLYGGKDPYTSTNKTVASEKTIGTRPHNKAGKIRNRRGTTSYRDSGDFETWGEKWKTKSDDLSIPF